MGFLNEKFKTSSSLGVQLTPKLQPYANLYITHATQTSINELIPNQI
jgi:hypothetical protein